MQRELLAPGTGEHIGNLLREAGISQERVAETFGLSQQAVSRRITGEVEFSTSQLVELSRMLDTSIDALLSPATPTAPSPAPSPVDAGDGAPSVGAVA